MNHVIRSAFRLAKRWWRETLHGSFLLSIAIQISGILALLLGIRNGALQTMADVISFVYGIVAILLLMGIVGLLIVTIRIIGNATATYDATLERLSGQREEYERVWKEKESQRKLVSFNMSKKLSIPVFGLVVAANVIYLALLLSTYNAPPDLWNIYLRGNVPTILAVFLLFVTVYERRTARTNTKKTHGRELVTT